MSDCEKQKVQEMMVEGVLGTHVTAHKYGTTTQFSTCLCLLLCINSKMLQKPFSAGDIDKLKQSLACFCSHALLAIVTHECAQ